MLSCCYCFGITPTCVQRSFIIVLKGIHYKSAAFKEALYMLYNHSSPVYYLLFKEILSKAYWIGTFNLYSAEVDHIKWSKHIRRQKKYTWSVQLSELQGCWDFFNGPKHIPFIQYSITHFTTPMRSNIYQHMSTYIDNQHAPFKSLKYNRTILTYL